MIPLLRKQTVYMPFTKLFTIFVGILSLIGPSNAFVALRPSWTPSSTTTSRHVIQFEHTALLLSEQSGLGSSISGFLSVSLLVSIATFYYANTVYTPEILENSKQMRLAAKEADRQKLLAVVQQHVADGLDLQDLRRPLETTFDMTIEEYVLNVETNKIEMTRADESLAQVLKPICLEK